MIYILEIWQVLVIGCTSSMLIIPKISLVSFRRRLFDEVNARKMHSARIRAKGYYPLLAHPERYLYMGMSDYRALKEAGLAFQLNLPSLVGMYGQQIQKKAVLLLKAGMYDLTGNDIHSSEYFKVLLRSRIDSQSMDRLSAHFRACRDVL